MAPSLSSAASSRYAIVIDAGSSGSRLQIYSWKDPEAERAQIIDNVKLRLAGGRFGGGSGTRKGKGKGKASEEEVEQEVEKALSRLVKIGKGVEGDDWVKRTEPGGLGAGQHGRRDCRLTCGAQASPPSRRRAFRPTSLLYSSMPSTRSRPRSTPTRPSTSSPPPGCGSSRPLTGTISSQQRATSCGIIIPSAWSNGAARGHAARVSASSRARRRACGAGSRSTT